MGQCAIIPQVRNKNNEIVDSKLFKDLLSSIGDRGTTVLTYVWADLQDFSKYKDVNKLDENGQPTLEFIDKTFGLHNIVESKKIISQIEKKEGMMNKDGKETIFMDDMKAYKVAHEFNVNNPLRHTYIANINKFMTGDTKYQKSAWKVRLTRKNALYALDASNQEYNIKLNGRIRDILSKFGVSTGALTELQRRMGISGVMDSTEATKTADGLIQLIRLADGVLGEKALPEEFAHFVVEAIQNSPLSKRIMNLIIDNNLSKELLGEEFSKYDELYDSNEVLLAKESLGKLLAKKLLEDKSVSNKKLGFMLPRWVTSAINWLKGNKEIVNELNNAKELLNKEIHNIASGVLSGDLHSQMSLESALLNPVTLYQVQNKVIREKKILKKIIDTEVKITEAFSERTVNIDSFNESQVSIVNKLQVSYNDAEYIDGVYTFLEHTLDRMQAINNRLTELRNDPDYLNNIQKSASVIKDASNYSAAYAGLIEELRKEIREAEFEGNPILKERLLAKLNSVSNLMAEFSSDFITLSKPLLAKYLAPFMGKKEVTITQGKDKGKVYTIESIIEKADSDIGFFDRWIFSMADSKDPLLRLIDLAVKKAHSSARMRVLEKEKDMKAALFVLEKSGIKNTEWMLNRDTEGNTNGRFISDIDYLLFNNNYTAEKERLRILHTKNGILNPLTYKIDLNSWLKVNREMRGGSMKPTLSIYKSEVFANLTPAQVKYYNIVIALKKELDSYLPTKYTSDKLFAPQIRKDLIERLKSNNISDMKGTLIESIKDKFIRREDESEYGYTKVDLKGNQMDFLPVYYTNPLENPNDVSGDITSTMIAYADMAIDFDEMNKVVDILELSKQVIIDREVVQTKNGKPIVEKIKSMGKTIENTLTKSGETSRILEKINSFYSAQVYGRDKKDEGTWGKLIDNAGQYTSVANLGLNFMAAVSNVGNAVIMTNIEAVAKEYFKSSSLLHADAKYAAGIGDVMLDIGKRVQTSKIALFNEHFNTIQGEDGKLRDLEMSKGVFSRLMNGNALFFLSHCGEHWIQTRTGLAMADEFKMKSPTGELVGLYDAMEVIDNIQDGQKVGARIKIKEGYLKQDGTEFIEDDRFKLENRILTINRKLNGSYNKADKSAIQQYSVGRASLLFRKWMVDSFNRRYQSSKYDFSLDSEFEGFYNTSGHFIKQLYQDAKGAQFHWMTRFNELTPHQKANIGRSFVELGTLLAITMALGLVDWGDDDNRPWLTKLTEYQLRRLKTEIGAITPNLALLTNMMTLLKSPTASIDTMNKVLNIFKVSTWFDELQSGPYKGEFKIYKYGIDITPMKSINRALNPQESIEFLKRQ